MKRPLVNRRSQQTSLTPTAGPVPGALQVANDARQEREVRLTAQRILVRHLRRSDDPKNPTDPHWRDISLDLNGATPIDFDLMNCKLHTASFSGARFTGDAWFDKATFTGNARFDEATFTGFAWFDGTRFTGDARFDEATFARNMEFAEAVFDIKPLLGTTWVRVDSHQEDEQSTWPPGWTVTDERPTTLQEHSGLWARVIDVPLIAALDVAVRT